MLATKTTYGILALIVAATLWGTTGVVATYAINSSAITIGAIAMGMGGLLQAVIAIKGIYQRRHYLISNYFNIFIAAISVAIYPLAFYSSMRCAGVITGTIVTLASAPLFARAIEWLKGDKKIEAYWLIGASMAIIGVIFIAFSAPQNGIEINSKQSDFILGVLLGLIAGFSYAFYSWHGAHLMRNCPPLTAMGSIFGLGGLMLLPIIIYSTPSFIAVPQNIAVGLYLGLLPMFIGYVCFGYGLAHIKASLATTITLIEPAIAAILATIILRETLTLPAKLGILLLFVSLVIITIKRNRQYPSAMK